jgi:hypothetical protein
MLYYRNPPKNEHYLEYQYRIQQLKLLVLEEHLSHSNVFIRDAI